MPKAIRDELQLRAGDSLELESSEQQIVLRPVRGNGPLRKKRGVWVFRTGEPLSAKAVNDTITEVRRSRDRDNLGQPDGGRHEGIRQESVPRQRRPVR